MFCRTCDVGNGLTVAHTYTRIYITPPIPYMQLELFIIINIRV